MNLGAAINNVLPYLRAQAESLQTQTVTIIRNQRLDQAVMDPATGLVTPTHTTVYSGKARVRRQARVASTDVAAGGETDSLMLTVISLPWSVTGIRPGDIVKVTAGVDPELMNDTFRVTGVDDGDNRTARRLTCELVESRQP